MMDVSVNKEWTARKEDREREYTSTTFHAIFRKDGMLEQHGEREKTSF